MSIFEHHRFEIWNQVQHPYKHSLTDLAYANNALNGVTTAQGALDYLIAVLYPNTKASVADVVSLPAVGNTINDYRVVLDDGDGKAAGYRWEQRESDASPKWYKIYDVDFGAGTYLAQAMKNYQDLFFQKLGNDDLDSSGVAVVGTFAGQTVYGGKSANTNLTLYANAGDAGGAVTGNIQLYCVQILGPNGSSSAPSYSFSNFPTMGLYAVSGGVLRLTYPDASEFQIWNAGTNDESILTLTNNGSSTGDQRISWYEGGASASGFSLGRDDTDGSLKLSLGLVLGTNDFLSCSTSGTFVIGPASGTGGGPQTIRVADTGAALGSMLTLSTGAAANLPFNITKDRTDGILILSGSSAGNTGGVLRLFGNTYGGGNNNRIDMQQGGTTVFLIDESNALTLGPANTLTHHVVNGSQVNFGRSSTATDVFLGNIRSDGSFGIFGDLSNQKSGIIIYGDSHGSLPSKVEFYSYSGSQILAGSYSAAGAWTLGASGSTATHTLNSQLNITNAFASSAGNQGLQLTNTAAADAWMRFATSSTVRWALGCDDSDSQSFKIDQATSLGANTAFGISGSLALTLGASGGTQTHTVNGALSVLRTTTLKSQASGTTLSIKASDDVVVATFNSGDAYTITLGRSGATETHTLNGSYSIQKQLHTVRLDVASATTIASLDATTSFVKLTGSTATTIQGITATGTLDGRRLTIVNLTGQNMTIAHENASAGDATYRITTMTGADVVTTANGTAEFIYDTGSSRWICLYTTS